MFGLAMPPLAVIAKYVAIVGIALFIGGYAVHRFDAVTIANMKLADAKSANQALQDVVTHIKAQDRATHDADVAYAESQQKTVTVTQAIIRKVPVYVTPKDDARCVLNWGFIRLYDAAGQGIDPSALPNRTAEPDSADSGISLSVSSALSAQNNGDAKDARDRIVNARDAWEAQSKTAVVK